MNLEDFDETPLKRGDHTPGMQDKSPLSKSSTPFLGQARRCCNCKQSKCLKLYCECYAAGVYCNPTCNCIDCWNNPKYEEHRKSAIKNTLEKNPAAFQPKISANAMEAKIIDMANYGKHSKGCACKKSGCMKKYCECFQAQIPCSDLCKCIDCQNNKEYYDNNKNQSVDSDIPKPQEITDPHSFFFKFLLAAGEADSPGKPMKVPALNKRLNASLGQEALEKLYERLLKIINLPMEEYLENEEYVKEIDIYDKKSILTSVSTENKDKEEEMKPKEEQGVINDGNNGGKEKPGMELEDENDDLICNEEVEELGGNADKGVKTQGIEEQKVETENLDKQEEKDDTVNETEEQKKLSLYKIKKNRIIREFISVLRELDT